MPRRSRAIVVLAALTTAMLTVAVIGLCNGTLAFTPSEVLRALAAPSDDATSALSVTAIRDLRLPRVLLALLVGAALASSGTAMQGLFRNPLADPGLIGVAAGAALAAVASIVLARGIDFDPQWLPWLTPAAAFGGGLMAATLAARLASADGITHTATLLLAGLAINAVAGAGIGLLIQLSGDAALRELTFWLYGSLGKSGWAELAVGAPVLLLVMLLLPRDARALNALLLGEAEAGHLGVDVERLKRRITALVVLAVAASVALAGIIGFVGLIVPHLLRLSLGPDHRLLLPASALGGASLLVLADVGARTWLSPAEIPVGVLTALIGAPFFLVLLLRFRNRVETW